MTRVYICSFFILFIALSSLAQEKDSLVMIIDEPLMRTSTGFYSRDYGNLKRWGDLDMVFRHNDEAYAQFKIAKRHSWLGVGFGLTGCLTLAHALDRINNNESSWGATLIGLGFLSASVPFLISKRSRLDRAIMIYNEGLPYRLPLYSISLIIGPAKNGIGLVWKF